MRARREAGAAVVGALVFLGAGLRLDAGGVELTRLAVLGSALGAIAPSTSRSTGFLIAS